MRITSLVAVSAALLAMGACTVNTAPTPAATPVVVQPAPAVVTPSTGTVVVQPQ